MKGGIVCVPVMSDTTQRLPSISDECEIVHVDLKRNTSTPTSMAMSDRLSEALDELKQTPLYAFEDVVDRLEDEFVHYGMEVACAEAQVRNAESETDRDDLQAGVEDSFQSTGEDNPQQLAHTDGQGFQGVADYAGCYVDESGLSDSTVPIATCMVPERSANELLQQALAFALAEGARPMRLFREKHGEDKCFINLFGGSQRAGSTASDFDNAKHELCNAYRRFAYTIENLFFKFFKHELLSLSGASNLSR